MLIRIPNILEINILKTNKKAIKLNKMPNGLFLNGIWEKNDSNNTWIINNTNTKSESNNGIPNTLKKPAIGDKSANNGNIISTYLGFNIIKQTDIMDAAIVNPVISDGFIESTVKPTGIAQRMVIKLIKLSLVLNFTNFFIKWKIID